MGHHLLLSKGWQSNGAFSLALDARISLTGEKCKLAESLFQRAGAPVAVK
jgi:hypothetical protein